MNSHELSEQAVRKVFRHLLWFLILIYVLSYIDRINIGFAALSMNEDLGITATMFGIAGTCFYITYGLFETPSNMLLAKYGARRWFSRIMVTWGLASAATIFAVGPYSLYFLRALVGLAEAGMLPGVLLYLGYWIPQAHRARANAIFLCALPGAIMIGGPISGVILQMDGFLGMAGWRWLLLLEGLPSVFVGIWVFFRLADGPQDAKFLTPEEKDALIRRIEAEHAAREVPGGPPVSVWREVRTRTVALLSLSYFCVVASINTIGTWSPLIVKDLLGGTDRAILIGLVTAIPPLFTILALPFISARSDKSNDRIRYLIGSMMLAMAGWMFAAVSATPVFKMTGLTLCTIGTFSSQAVFWAMAAPLLSKRVQPVAIGIISTAGIGASVISPSIVGVLRDTTHSFNAGLWYAAGLLVLGIFAVLIIAGGRTARLKMA